MNRGTWRIARFAVLAAIIALGLILSQRPDEPLQPRGPTPSGESAPQQTDQHAAVVRAVTVKDLEGDIAFQGDVDLTETLARIDADKRLKFRNDGAVFENREKRLPGKAMGYYREYVHPTPGLSGPGPQRIVVGAAGEAYYTPDHYRTFDRIR